MPLENLDSRIRAEGIGQQRASTWEEVGVLSSDLSPCKVCTKDDTAFSLDSVQS